MRNASSCETLHLRIPDRATMTASAASPLSSSVVNTACCRDPGAVRVEPGALRADPINEDRDVTGVFGFIAIATKARFDERSRARVSLARLFFTKKRLSAPLLVVFYKNIQHSTVS
jgi:hypothetical protein